MPTAPNPDSPYLDSRLQAVIGHRFPGMPSSAGKPGVQSGDLSFPAPPALASGPSGRPPDATAPAPAPTDGGGGGPAPTAAPAAPQQVSAQPASQPQEKAPLGQPQGATTPSADPGAIAQMRNRIYQEAVYRKREQLGSVPEIFRHPTLGEMPVELGRWNFNPFSGQWVR